MPPKLLRLAGLLQGLVWLGIVLLVALPTANWAGPGVALRPAAMVGAVDLTAGQRLVAWLLVMPPYIAIALGLYRVTGFCRSVRRRELFAAAAGKALHRFGWSLIAGSLLLPASRIAFALYLAHGSTATVSPQLGAAFGLVLLLYAALLAIFGLVLVVFAAILGEAGRLAEENASFV
jgi:uncharacterized Tic20 family protein